MALLTEQEFYDKYNLAASGLFKTNFDFEIEEVDLRELVQDIKDNFIHKNKTFPAITGSATKMLEIVRKDGFIYYVPLIEISETPQNQNPTVNAGADQNLAAETTSTTLNGTASDTDGTISSLAWTQVSGPNQATITTPTQINTTVNGLIAGSYVFRLTAADDQVASSSDDITINVAAYTRIHDNTFDSTFN